jgi:hypothetical protein
MFDAEPSWGSPFADEFLEEVDHGAVGSVADRMQGNHSAHVEGCSGQLPVGSVETHGSHLIWSIGEWGVHRRCVTSKAPIGKSLVSDPPKETTPGFEAPCRIGEPVDSVSDDKGVDGDRKAICNTRQASDLVSQARPRTIAETQDRPDRGDTHRRESGQRAEQ